MAPLSSFLDDPAAAALQSEPRQQIAEGVVLATTARYQTMAAEMLDTVRVPVAPCMCLVRMSHVCAHANGCQQAVVCGIMLPHDGEACEAHQVKPSSRSAS